MLLSLPSIFICSHNNYDMSGLAMSNGCRSRWTSWWPV